MRSILLGPIWISIGSIVSPMQSVPGSGAPAAAPAESDEILVTAKRLSINPGLWRIEEGATRAVGGRPKIVSPARTYEICLATKDVSEFLLDVFAGVPSERPVKCKDVRYDFHNGNIFGRWRCPGAVTYKKTLAGKITPDTLNAEISINVRISFSTPYDYTKQISGNRLGQCVKYAGE